MTRASLIDLPERPLLMPGIAIRGMNGLAEAERWTQIQREADPFHTISDDLFSREFGMDDAVITSRCLIAADTATGEAVAAASAWFGGSFGARGEDWGRLHWVAVCPAYQRRGIARSLVVECLYKMAELGHERAYLVTSTDRLGAVALYEAVGFSADLS